MPPIILFSCALIFQSLALYYLGTKEIKQPSSSEKNQVIIPPAYSLQKRHTLFAFSILIISHITGIIIFNLMQPSFGWKYLAQLEEKQVNTIFILCLYMSY